ncbi:MAG: hypothetical protein MI974_19035 [Chitinophagales bacterium]|nr:hypothetical protein [Chitinophagales bacterium]
MKLKQFFDNVLGGLTGKGEKIEQYFNATAIFQAVTAFSGLVIMIVSLINSRKR